jgi:hypothetical protein
LPENCTLTPWLRSDRPRSLMSLAVSRG